MPAALRVTVKQKWTVNVRYGSLAAAATLIGGVRSCPISGHAIVADCSLILGTISLLRVLKFPVQLRGDFVCKPLKLVGEQATELQRKAGFREIPCLFPC